MECILIAKNWFSSKIDTKWFGSKYTISERFRRLNLCKINYQHKDIIIPGNHLSENVNTSKVFIMGVSKIIWENILGHIPTFFSLMLKEPCRLGACHFGNPVVTEFWRGCIGQCSVVIFTALRLGWAESSSEHAYDVNVWSIWIQLFCFDSSPSLFLFWKKLRSVEKGLRSRVPRGRTGGLRGQCLQGLAVSSSAVESESRVKQPCA